MPYPVAFNAAFFKPVFLTYGLTAPLVTLLVVEMIYSCVYNIVGVLRLRSNTGLRSAPTELYGG
ncbi:3703_t:CDS:2, partial [Acaulospora morrowiae]